VYTGISEFFGFILPKKTEVQLAIEKKTKELSKNQRGIDIFGNGFSLEELNNWLVEIGSYFQNENLSELTQGYKFNKVFKEVNGKYYIDTENATLEEYLQYLRDRFELTLEEGSEAYNNAVEMYV